MRDGCRAAPAEEGPLSSHVHTSLRLHRTVHDFLRAEAAAHGVPIATLLRVLVGCYRATRLEEPDRVAVDAADVDAALGAPRGRGTPSPSAEERDSGPHTDEERDSDAPTDAQAAQNAPGGLRVSGVPVGWVDADGRLLSDSGASQGQVSGDPGSA